MPSDTDYSCHIAKGVELIYPIIWGPYHATLRYVVIDSLESRHTYTQTHIHPCTNNLDKSKFMKPGWHAWFKNSND